MKRTTSMLSRLFCTALAALALAGCATGPKLSGEQRLALYREHAGAPVDSFQYFGSINGWTPLGDSALALWTKPSQAYLLELNGRCPDLDFAQAITVSNQMGRVHQRFDTELAQLRKLWAARAAPPSPESADGTGKP